MVIEAGRRSGKTELAKRHECLSAMTAPPSLSDYRGLFLAPVRDQARTIYWDDVKALTSAWWSRDPSEQYLTVYLENGARLEVHGMDRPQRIEGSPIDSIKVDEFADMKPDVWDRNLRPALDTEGRLGRAWIYGVPRPSGQFKTLAELGQDPDEPDYEYFHWTAETVIPERAAAAKRTMDPLLYAQEYLAQRTNFAGLAYHCFNRDAHVHRGLRDLAYNPRHRLDLCFDFNVSPGVAVVVQEADTTGPEWETIRATVEAQGLTLADEVDVVLGEVWIRRHSTTRAVCRRLVKDWGSHEGWIRLFGDPTGGAGGTAKEHGPDWEIIPRELRAGGLGSGEGVGIHPKIERRGTFEAHRLASTNWAFQSADGVVSCLIDAGAEHLIEDYATVCVLEGGSGEIDKKADPSITHSSDALGYRMAVEHPALDRRVEVETV